MNTSTKVLPPPRHFYSFGCGFCGAGDRKYVSYFSAIRASQRHTCKSKQITIYHHIHFWDREKPVTEIYGAK